MQSRRKSRSFKQRQSLWIAEKFQQDHIDELKQLLKDNPHKYINLYAVEIQPDVLKRIEHLNTVKKLNLWNELDTINEIKGKLKVVDCYLQIPKTHIGRAHIGKENYDLESDYGIKKYLMGRFLERMPYYLNIHYSKKHSKDNKQL